MYSPLEEKVCEEARAFGLKAVKDDFVSNFLKANLPRKRLRKGELENIEHFRQNLDNKRPKKKSFPVSKKKSLTSRERRKLKLFDLPKEGQKFETYLPMHELWKDYMRQTLGLADKSKSFVQHNCESILKADFHGCFLTVSKSCCPSYIGATGIVIMETKNTFKIITKQNHVKCIPKRNSVFMFEIDGHYITLYGNNFCCHPVLRSTYKFKPKKYVAI
ncbi:ribonuclease P protein subunit p29-like [Saccostrea echinata]|uniref:ribonuclease P protein subunit p29-like n=1 Tax=Saccostrea echinata TaxID=191078 RepID=UPI002A7EC1C7|nr:ribonuclease P protein subunit p29-like [Saccostrea echinata]